MDALEFIRIKPDGGFLLQNAILEGVRQFGLELAGGPRYLTVLEAEKDSIAIQAIRELTRDLRLRPDRAEQRRVIIIADAHKLTAVAQNAF